MTIFAGVFARSSNQEIPDELISELQSGISRSPEDNNALIEYKNKHIYIAKIDIGALGEPGHFTDSELVGFLAGDPVLQHTSEKIATRLGSLKLLAEDVSHEKFDLLRECRGTYCAVVYEPEKKKLSLITDKIGVRPVYFWIQPNFIVFASALRILEALCCYQREIDLKGISEITCFGYPLSDRTPYKDIFSLYAGEVASFEATKIERKKYWDWSALPLKKIENTVFAKQLHEIFIESIKIRLKKQKTVAAFLSGGLDSRAIVAALRELHTNVITANFAPQGSQDQVFGQLIADALGTHHSHLPKGKTSNDDSYHKHSTKNWINSEAFRSENLVRPKIIWSGDGGSMGLGHIYQNAEIVNLAREKDLDKAKKIFFSYNRWGIFPKLLKQPIESVVRKLLAEGVQSELNSIQPEDPGRLFYLFLLLNDQRRHMFVHFEDIDLDRIELELPFFDADLITAIVQQPIDRFLRHAFYLDWLAYFDPKVLAVPWQAYPGHVPCPHLLSEDLEYQWESTPEDLKQTKNIALQFANTFCQNSEFMSSYVNKLYFYLWLLLLKWGNSNHSYLVRFPSILYRYWAKAR